MKTSKLTGATVTYAGFLPGGDINPSVPDASPADAGWRRRFQRPRAGRPVMIILRQRTANHLSLEVSPSVRVKLRQVSSARKLSAGGAGKAIL